MAGTNGVAMTAYHLPELTFYITDTCGLACKGCITHNELPFANGHLELDPAARERMHTWSRLITVTHIHIIGGEPMSHPRLAQWMQHIQALWPHAERYTIVSNGEHLAQQSQLVCAAWELGWDLEISAHSTATWTAVQSWFATVSQQFVAPPQHHVAVLAGERTDWYSDSHGQVLMQLSQHTEFYPRRYHVAADHVTWQPLTSATQQHALCKGRDCVHMVQGVMYRCPIQATVPRLARQFRVEGTAGLAQQDLGFDPLRDTHLSAWIDSMLQPTPQCSLCDWREKRVPLENPYAKKVRIVRYPK